jgi:hypothetical protein
MPAFPDHSVEKIQSLGHIEQSASIDTRVSRKKKRDSRSNNKRRHYQPTINEQLEEEQALRETMDDDSGHIDFHA